MAQKLLKNTALTFILTLTLAGCGSSGSGDKGTTRSFSGLWNVFFTIVVDECGLLEVDEITFEDEHEITEDGQKVTLDTLQLLSGSYEGSLRAEDSFTASSSIDGDIFGVGVNCTLTEDVAYNDLNDDTASTIYNVRIVCDDGTVCDSFTRGTAVRVEE